MSLRTWPFVKFSQVRSDIHVCRRHKSVGKVVHGIDVKTRSALIGMLRVFLRPEDSILDGIKPHVEKRSRISASAQIAAQSETAFRKQISAQGEVGGSAQRQIVTFGNAKTLLT